MQACTQTVNIALEVTNILRRTNHFAEFITSVEINPCVCFQELEQAVSGSALQSAVSALERKGWLGKNREHRKTAKCTSPGYN